MKILVSVASKHGATREIADEIAEELRRAGVDVVESDMEDAPAPAGFDAVVLGSGVYIGNWLREARHYVEAHRAALASMPVWLFSSGPLGDEPPAGDPAARVQTIAEQTHARDSHLFAGRIDPASLNVFERLVLKMVHSPVGDYRDWDEVRGWARAIVRSLAPAPA